MCLMTLGCWAKWAFYARLIHVLVGYTVPMAETLKFIHSADLHLGAPFRGLRKVSGPWAERLMRAIPEAYERMIQAALDNRVDFVIIAGDSFDLSNPTYREYLCFLQGLERLREAGIPVYMITGNHDPLSGWRSVYGNLPDNVQVFPADAPGFLLYERDGEPKAVLAGRSWSHQSWPENVSVAEGITRDVALTSLRVRVPFCIGVLHTGLDIDPARAPVSPKQLEAAGMDYWALGHIHTPRQNSRRNPSICFSGCLQGRATKETGPHGVNLVTLTEGEPNKVTFIPTASVVYEKVKVDISGLSTVSQIVQETRQALFRVNATSQCDEMIERIVLTGATSLHHILQQPGVMEDLRLAINDAYNKFFCDVLENRTKPLMSKKSLRKEGLLPATLLQVADEAKDAKDGDIEYLQQRFFEKGLYLPRACERKIDRLQDEAEALVLDLLEGGKL